MMMPMTKIGKKVQSFVAISALALMTACAPTMPTTTTGPKVDTSKPVPVALLVPQSSDGTAQIAADLENAARLAAANWTIWKSTCVFMTLRAMQPLQPALRSRPLMMGQKSSLDPLCRGCKCGGHRCCGRRRKCSELFKQHNHRWWQCVRAGQNL